MPRGYPDYGIVEEFGKLLRPTDVAELAARLGSIAIYDRRGDVVLFDGFEAPVLNWYVNAFGGGGSVVFTNTSNRAGVQAVKLATSAVASEVVQIEKYIYPLISDRIGFEVSFSQMGLLADIRLFFSKRNGTTRVEGGLSLQTDAEEIRVQTGATTWVAVADLLTPVSQAHVYYPHKVVVNFNTKKYMRLMTGGIETDLSDYSLYETGDTESPRLFVAIYLGNINGDAQEVKADDFILTMNEP